MAYISKNKFAYLVKREMVKQGLSLRQLAENCDISPAYLSLVLNGKREAPQPEIIDRMTRALGLEPPILHLAAGLVPKNDRRWDQFFNRLQGMTNDQIDDLIEFMGSMKKKGRR